MCHAPLSHHLAPVLYVGYIYGVLGYMVEYWVTWWSIWLHPGECCITWGMLDHMKGSVGLPGNSPIRELLFNTRWRGACQKNLVNDPEKSTTPLCAHDKFHAPLDCKSIYIYPNSIVL